MGRLVRVRDRFFTVALGGRKRGNGHKLIKESFRLRVMRNFFPVRTVRQ